MTTETVLGLACITLTPVVQVLKTAAARSWTAILALVCLAALMIGVIEVVRSDWVLALTATFVGLDFGFRLIARIEQTTQRPVPRLSVGVFLSRFAVEGALFVVILVLFAKALL